MVILATFNCCNKPSQAINMEKILNYLNEILISLDITPPPKTVKPYDKVDNSTSSSLESID